MIMVDVPESDTNSINVKLEHDDMVIDPRHMHERWYVYKFRFSVKGRTLTITRIDEDGGWEYGICLRAYLPMEDIPDFTLTVYTYWGLEDEQAPPDTTEVIFHPSATRIGEYAFDGCKSLERITIPDTVTTIGDYAFYCCHSLRFIQLSTNLEFIGGHAFHGCKSIEAAFLPPTVLTLVIGPSKTAHH